MKRAAKLFVASLLAFATVSVGPGLAQQRSSLGAETLQSLQESVSRLKTKVEASTTLIAEERTKIKSIETNIEMAAQVTDDMIARFKEMADEFAAGGDYQATLKKADADLLEKVEKFRNGSEVQRKVSANLEEIRQNFITLDKRRDDALQVALKEIRRLEANKGDIEALIVLNNYQQLQTVLGGMLDAFEATIAEAKTVNNEVAKTANISSE